MVHFVILKVQYLKFYTNGKIPKSRESSIVIASIKYNKNVSPKKVNEWNGFLLIPSTCPTSSGLCKLIDISYELVFIFDPSGFSLKTELVIPIVLGKFN